MIIQSSYNCKTVDLSDAIARFTKWNFHLHYEVQNHTTVLHHNFVCKQVIIQLSCNHTLIANTAKYIHFVNTISVDWHSLTHLLAPQHSTKYSDHTTILQLQYHLQRGYHHSEYTTLLQLAYTRNSIHSACIQWSHSPFCNCKTVDWHSLTHLLAPQIRMHTVAKRWYTYIV